MVKNEFETFCHGLCPNCLNIMDRPKNGGIGTCECGKSFSFYIASLLLDKALCQGSKAAIEKIIELLPDVFFLPHGTAVTGSADFSGHLKLRDIKKTPDLARAIVAEGSEVIRGIITAKQEEIKEKYALEISAMDAAAIIAHLHILQKFGNYYGTLDENIVIQDLNELEKTPEGEFAISYKDIKDCWHKMSIENGDDVISFCQPEIQVRYEKEGDSTIAYIKCDLPIFVVTFRSHNWPPGSHIFVFHKGAVN